MKMSRVIVFIRWTLSALLIYGVYTETGIFTTIALGLSVISIEIMSSSIKHVREILQALQGKAEEVKK